MISFPHNVFRFVLANVVRPFAVTTFLATGFGAGVRLLNVAAFVLILQALLLAALPENGGGRLATLQDAFSSVLPIAADITPAAMAIGLVIIAHILLLLAHIGYQKLLGRLIAIAGEKLSNQRNLVGQEDIQARQLITAAAVNCVRVLEVSLFLILLFAVISFFDFRISLILGIGCALALVIIVLTRKSSVLEANDVGDLRKEYVQSGKSDGREAQAYLQAQERLRYRRGTAAGWDSTTLGLVVSAVILLLLAGHIDVSEHAVYAFFLVFAMRFAIAYTRDLARALTALFDLRVNPLLRAIARSAEQT